MDSPLISVIIVCTNERRVIGGCLRSLRRAGHEAALEIIVVDNASSDGSVDYLQLEFPEAKILRNEKNLGFAGAMNVGFREATGQYLLPLNPDTIVPRGTLRKLLSFIENHEKVGIVGAYLTGIDGTPQDSSFRFPTLPREFLNYLPEIKAIIRPRVLMDSLTSAFSPRDNHEQAARVDGISGAAFLVRSTIARELNGFDEEFFVYHEERDFCRRTRNLGWEVWSLPTAQVIHLEAQTTGYRRHKLPKMPLLGWRIAGMDRLFWKHRSILVHALWRLQVRFLLSLRIYCLFLTLPFRGKHEATLERLRDLRKARGMLKQAPVSECERP